MTKFNDRQIIASWQKNGQPWAKAVREGEIASRVRVTNNAIVQCLVERSPKSCLDIGCGEGWLVRTLAGHGIDCMGIDVVPELIELARAAGGGRFRQLAYEELSVTTIDERFDALVCNFSLLGKESVEQVFAEARGLLNEGGALIVQTLHPGVNGGHDSLQKLGEDGWREGSWRGFNGEFSDPAPWYFRTLHGWESLFLQHGFTLAEVLQPPDPLTGSPASVIFTGTV